MEQRYHLSFFSGSSKVKVCAMAEVYKRPVAMHDCTGPLTLYAGIHLAINATNAIYQESVRAYMRVNYPDLVTELPVIENGHFLAPTKPHRYGVLA